MMKKITTLLMMLLMVTLGFSQTELVTNGDFEATLNTPAWYGNAFNIVDQGGNRLNEADVQTAGDVFSVNLSQEIVLEDGKTYKLTFDSFTDATTGSRDIVVGLGQTGAPFNALVETVNITSSSQTFTKQITINYGDAVTDRVIFDIGGAVGFVFIDNVSVVEVQNTCNNGVQDGDETGVDCGGSCAPCTAEPATAAPTPTVPASDVISLFSDAYTDVTVTTWSADWDTADIQDIDIAGNATKKITFGGFLGVDFAANAFDATNMTHFHMDYWIDADFTNKVFNPKWSNHQNGNGETNAYDYNNEIDQQTSGQWISLDIPLSSFTPVNGADRSAFAQFLLTSNIGGVAYVDNIYLYSNVPLSNNAFAQAEFKVYPNPTKDSWNIQTTENIKNVQVFNITGRLVKEVKVNASETVINTNGLSSGVYLAKISNEFDQTKTIKLIKE